jgi:cortexillin 1/2
MSKPKGDDRQWETLQVKAFVHWVNGYLERRGLKVEKLEEDFCDGVLLIAFIEELTGGKLNKRWNTNPTTRVLKIENCHQAIMLLKENYHIKNITISAEDITNGNLKLILGFLWLLFREFRIAKIEGAQDKSYEEGVLLWVRQTLRNYTDLNISNFSSSFSDGKIFLALLKEYDSTLVDYAAFKKENKEENLETAFRIAESALKIPRLLNVKQLAAEQYDERSVALYVSLFLNAFHTKMERNKMAADNTAIATQVKDLEMRLQKAERDKEELSKIRNGLESRVNELQTLLNEQRRVNEELLRSNNNLKVEMDELRTQFATAKEKETYLEQKAAVLKQMLDKETEEKTEFEVAKETAEREAAKLKAEKEVWLKERERLQRERDALEQELYDVRDALDTLKLVKEKLESKTRERAELEGRGLDVLRKNLLEHVKDMNTWKEFLEQERDYEADTIQTKTEKEIISLSFEEQLEYLARALSDENKRLQALLEDHDREKREKARKEKSDKNDKNKDS